MTILLIPGIGRIMRRVPFRTAVARFLQRYISPAAPDPEFGCVDRYEKRKLSSLACLNSGKSPLGHRVERGADAIVELDKADTLEQFIPEAT
jgi:hypothetical protein